MNKVKAKKAPPSSLMLPIVHPLAAGIDVGDKEMVVAVPEGSHPDQPRVRTFGTMTCDLMELVGWLQELHIQSVAMESTGVYWKPLCSLLKAHDIEVFLVNARHAKNVTGRKTDELDAMWILKLHSCGLLSSSYLPDDEQEILRTLVRYRRTLQQDSSRFINRIEKSLELMNIKFHTIISDITGRSGRAVLEAIIAGERQAENFLVHVNQRIKASREEIIKSMQGTYREEHLFTLTQSYEMYCIYLQRIEACDKQIEQRLQCYTCAAPPQEPEPEQPQNKLVKKAKPAGRKQKNSPAMDVKEYLKSIHGVDVTEIYGISDISAMELLAETGTDMSKWPTENHFVSWLNLCPNNKISAGKLLSSKVLSKKSNSASRAFRQAANAVQRSDNWLGDFFRRKKSKGGNKYAIIATARKLAIIYYKMVRYKQPFKPVDMEGYQSHYKQAKIAYLERKLESLKKPVLDSVV